jgi:hypothetical protein
MLQYNIKGSRITDHCNLLGGHLCFFGYPFHPAQATGRSDRRWSGSSGMYSEFWLSVMRARVL